ncbi:hypothetical protein FHN55_12325 [Streptomyces sp. NP160]|uniref:type II secretion system F family protein n=1 Tax=Streptomyces sp. NP160 TaxID=2586637 RepID=UPI001117D21E|nr:type II secretion system F family protein [Streptomyces sp. NP160]TNM66883.1 hypothetical protein FHN55_12325 [Streptomyces sp. NP160]
MLQLSLVAGLIGGLGILLLLREVVPGTPHLRSTIARLTAEPVAAREEPAVGLEARLGRIVADRVQEQRWARVPRRDLAVLQVAPAAWFGQKALFAVVGLLFPPLMGVAVALAGLDLPFALPAAGSVALATALWFVPDVEVRSKATSARAEFARAVTAYIDLTALERAGGTGTTQSLENAAAIADSWVFQRIREALHRARWSGEPPWRALSELAEELGVPELDDMADIMRLSGEEGVAVQGNLRARSRSMRTAMLSREQARANADSERMVIPVALLGLLFLCLLAFPALARVL